MKHIREKLTGTTLVLLIILACVTTVWAATDFKPQYHNKGTIGSKLKTWAEGWFKDLYIRGGKIEQVNDSGTTDFYIPADRVVYITKASQLTSLSGDAATAGQSVFWTEPGKTYIVDPHALYLSGVTDGNGVSAFTNCAFNGVTLFLPDAAKFHGPAYDVTVMLATTGGTGYAVAQTGATPVIVAPFPGNAGLTAYGKTPATYATEYRGSCTPYTMHRMYGINGTIGHNAIASGATYWEIDRTHESATFGSENSSVSQFVKHRHVFN